MNGELSAAAAVARRLEGEPRPEQEPAAAGLGDKNRLLAEQVAGLREALERQRGELGRARLRLAEAEREVRALSAAQVALEEEKANLARLYVAASMLHATLDAGEVLDAVRDVVINLLGSEEFAVLEFDPGTAALAPLTWMGIDPDRLRELRVGVGPVGAALRTGEAYVRGADAREDGAAHGEVAACIPLRLAGSVYGVVVIYSLLPQKPGFVPLDGELFELLGRHAAMALYTARLHALLHASARVG